MDRKYNTQDAVEGEMIHILGRAIEDFITTYSDTQSKNHDLFISEIFHIIFLNHN